MPTANRPALPDPEAARRLISNVVPEIGLLMAAQARAQAETVRRFLDGRKPENAPQKAVELVDKTLGFFNGMTVVFQPFFLPRSMPQNPISTTLRPVHDALMTFLDLRRRPESGVQVRPVLTGLRDRLMMLSRTLTSLPPTALLPSIHPPGFARLREDVVAESVAENLAKLVDDGLSRYEACQAGIWPDPRQETLGPRFRWGFNPFLTGEVRDRYVRATEGFEQLELFGERKVLRPYNRENGWQPALYEFSHYRTIVGDKHPGIYAAYVAIAINYLSEVLGLMPDYAEASGQGRRRDPVTVYGNVGAIHSQVTNSSISAANTITNIGTTIQAVADRGEVDVADAIRALAEAIQRDSGLAEDLRAQLLDHVADVADAAVAPDEPRRLSRARAAMAAITAAAGPSSQLAVTVGTWHDVLRQFF
ncbi:hypothetical protein [Streptomyces sp. NPDC048155]|uniref:hypothetical protein n=1 Tax=Streptomyces sp. NPDC048155 TaxID=3154818 RepID=UPI0033CFE548